MLHALIQGSFNSRHLERGRGPAKGHGPENILQRSPYLRKKKKKKKNSGNFYEANDETYNELKFQTSRMTREIQRVF